MKIYGFYAYFINFLPVDMREILRGYNTTKTDLYLSVIVQIDFTYAILKLLK